MSYEEKTIGEMLRKFNKGSSLMKKAKPSKAGNVKTYVVREGVTQTVVTEYLVEATSRDEAMRIFASRGTPNGSHVGSSDDEGVKVLN